MYPWLVYLHVIAVFGFLMAHGVSIAVALTLRREREPRRISTLLALSGSSIGLMDASILILLITGIITGFIGHWWGRGWIWTSLALLLAIAIYMSVSVVRFYHQVRKAIGEPYMINYKPQPAVPPASSAELDALLNTTFPVILSVVGLGGLAVITWLMLFKPF